MSIIPGQLSQQERVDLKDQLVAADNGFIAMVPKVELHVHIEGTLTPQLRWDLAQRHGMKAQLGSKEFDSAEALEQGYYDVISSAQLRPGEPSDHLVTFFQAYYSGFQYLKTKQDYFELAMGYFQRAAKMNVRYCEPFFDPQAHTSRGVAWEDLMSGLLQAQEKAAKELNVRSSWIMCFLRDESVESAMEHYKAALRYKDMIIGIGLDSNERDNPPEKFQDVLTQARKDGFKITAHCDVGVKNTHEHIRQVASTLANTGADRIDHGLNVADRPELVELVKQRGIGLTICPWAYLRRETYQSIADRIRLLVDAGIKVCICCDSPAYTDIAWITHNLLLARRMCGFTDGEILAMARNSVEMTWAPRDVKDGILREIDSFELS